MNIHSVVAKENGVFDEAETLHKLRHYLPAQSPLKDFVHHNTLHAFQGRPFFEGIKNASNTFGYKTTLSLPAYRKLYQKGKINDAVLERIIAQKKGDKQVKEWKQKLTEGDYDTTIGQQIGKLRANWKEKYKIDLDALVHLNLFRLINSFLDQGIAIWKFPETQRNFLSAIREMERNTYSSFFKSPRVRNLLLKKHLTIKDLLKIVVFDERYFEQYLFDQQFAHPGYSGMVNVVEHNPATLLDKRRIRLEELIILELLFEIDALDHRFGETWMPIGLTSGLKPVSLFKKMPFTELDEVIQLWQLALEWSFYDEVLHGLTANKSASPENAPAAFQAFFCIDDRECSIRRYVEALEPRAKTYGTPGHFGLEFYFKPEHGKFTTKVCPAPVTPAFEIHELETKKKQQKEVHFSSRMHHWLGGWAMTQTVGIFSAFKMFADIFRPTNGPLATSSFNHMDKFSRLTIQHEGKFTPEGLQIGFTIEQMAERVQRVLTSTGLVQDFAPLVYLIGHGASSINNTYYAGYDCGACSGRPGSVNARVFAYMANLPEVRQLLAENNIFIPQTTQFIGGLHDTTRDEMEFYDEDVLNAANQQLHKENVGMFNKALDLNAKERSRRFISVDSNKSPEKVHDAIRQRSVTLYEPRPELNHATNCLCIVGKRELTHEVFLDRRAFMNSYDYAIDPDGTYLQTILNAAAPVCGGINLEYYFSRVDNYKLGAGSKLPHNVMGLIAVANGIEGDLRPGLPTQMTEMHDPLRLLMVIEHYPEVAMKAISANPATYEWFGNEWVRLAVIHPETRAISVLESGRLIPYKTIAETMPPAVLPTEIRGMENLPVAHFEVTADDSTLLTPINE